MANILENIVYLGHTLSMKHTMLSYKNKKQIRRPESKQILVKNTHAPLVSQELWEIVQEVRRHKRRPPKHMEEPNLFSGLVYCSDCGQYLVLCRTEKMREDQYYFRCSTYGKRGKDACTPHQIREVDLKQIVLDDLRRVTHFARMKEWQFAEYINQKNTLELRREINRVQKELDAMRRRNGELSALFKRLYEYNVLGRVTNEQFRMLSADYNEEQLERLKASVNNVDSFIEKAK
ncbi:recombinase zinc beta ribbon domain-containing protein [Lawsonibacter sp. OA9]|uniref:recombinase zinc beta ribbon domain-containing protein n=1 Tax=Oscillospiraceae TaxID=216572 RepID=UPI00399A106B